MKPLITKDDLTRIKEIESYLKDSPVVFGVSYHDRSVWDNFPEERKELIIKTAQKMLTEPDIIITEELFLRYTTIGDRQLCDNTFFHSSERVRYFALAECIENKGNFVMAYENAVKARCEFNTWVLTAHDTTLDNFYKRDVTIDLGSASFSWDIVLADYIMADKASSATRELIYANVMWRTIEPFEQMLQGSKEANWWFFTTNNWASVCLSCVIGTILAMDIEKSKKATFIAAWEKYIENPKKGYTEDGYCSEGLSYWSYGFSHYLYGAEIIRKATYGKIDSFSNKKMQTVGLFPERMSLGGTYPSIADCKIGYTPEHRPIYYINRRLGLQLPPFNEDITTLYADLLFWINGEDLQKEFDAPKPDEFPQLRSWFSSAGVLICRPSNYTKEISVSLKGGHNNEHHNHNDVGSFVVSRNGVQLISDIGHEYYNDQTFSDNRYKSNFYNSYGHSVPLVAGKLQKPHSWTKEGEILYAGEILGIDFAPKLDYYKLDLSKAYEIDDVLDLARTFTYNREDGACLEVVDSVKFNGDNSFETAILTYGKVLIDNNIVHIALKGEELSVSFECTDSFEIVAETINGDIAYASPFFEGLVPTRVAFRLPKVKETTVKMIIR